MGGGGEHGQSDAEEAASQSDQSSRYLGDLAGAQNLPRMHLVSEQHHMAAGGGSAQLVHRLHHHLRGGVRGQR